MSAIDHAALEEYLVRTRWFAGKSRPFHVGRVQPIAELSADEGRTNVSVSLVTVEYSDDEGGSETYQVPLSWYSEYQERIGHAFVVKLEHEDPPRYLFDAVHDRDAMAIWLDGFIAAESDGRAEVGGLLFRRVEGGLPLNPEWRGSPLSGEQSNSSVRYDDTAIMKVFRKVSPGLNPDIEIHEELTRGESDAIADLYGWIEAEVDGEVVQLAMLQEFLRTAADGFELATGSVRTLFADPEQSVVESGGDFAGEAARLGAAVAEIHAMLRARFPSERRGGAAVSELAHVMNDRLDNALRAVPELEPYVDELRATYAAVAALEGLDVQRVHGDLHLGQTLRTSHGWRIVDFEGEPGRPFRDRALPDSPWRDVAGMLRSFDYAPGVVELSQSGPGQIEDEESALRSARGREWSERARGSFLDAYVAALDVDDERALADQQVLLDAYVADKAVYEAIYEKRNRPAWISIPLAAIEEIVRG